jgi:lysyl-tRNA synthetase class 2
MPSTVIRTHLYDAGERKLAIEFTTGRRYLYHDVPPQEYERFRSAFSKGRYFNAHIRDNYRYTELESA